MRTLILCLPYILNFNKSHQSPWKDHRRKIDFVLVFEEDKKDVDIEIPKVCLCFCCCFSNQQIIRNWREQNWGSLRLLRLSSKVWFLETPELVLILTESYIPNFFRKNLTTLFIRKLGKKKQRFKLWRKKFLSGLQSVGLDIEDVGLIVRCQMELTEL